VNNGSGPEGLGLTGPGGRFSSAAPGHTLYRRGSRLPVSASDFGTYRCVVTLNLPAGGGEPIGFLVMAGALVPELEAVIV
jgi:hypothetical protein